MRNLSTIFAILLTLNLNAQYHPLAEQGQQWNILDRVTQDDYYTFIYAVEGDTAISGNMYPLLTHADSFAAPAVPFGYIIEDTVQQTVAIEFFDTSRSTIFYDFSLQPGDHITYDCPFIGDTGRIYLDSITFVSDSAGTQRRQFHFSTFNPVENGSYHNWIEGFGSVENFLLNMPPCVVFKTSPVARTLCISDKNGQILYDNPNYQTCFEKILSKKEPESARRTLFPNPAGQYIHLRVEEQEKDLPYRIFNINGIEVKKGVVNNNLIDVEDLPAGIYFLQLKDEHHPQKWVKR